MEKRYTLILGQNGTQIHLLEDGPVSPLVPGIFLTLHFALGLALNIALILGMFTSSTLRGFNFNRLLLQLSLACAFDCFLNITAAVAFLAVTHLELSSKYAREVLLACRLNAALMEWTTVTQSAFLAALVADRALALQVDAKNNNNNSYATIRIASVMLWFYATAIVAPIAVSSSTVGTSLFPYRYSCGVVPNSRDVEDLVYPLLLLVLGYIVPWTVTSLGSLKVIRHIFTTRRRRRLLEEAGLTRSQRLQQTSSSWMADLAWDEVTFYWLVSALLLCFILLLLPHDLYVNILTLTFNTTSGTSKNTHTTGSKSTEISEVLTGTLDCVFVWCRYSFTVIAPLTVLAVHKEVRKSCEHLFCCCCRGNSVVHLDDARSISACVQKRMEQEAKKTTSSLKTVRGRKDKYTRAASYRTPVLFATSEGLHLRLVEDKDGSYTASGDKEQSLFSEPRFICDFCDVAILTPTSMENGINPSNSLRQSFIARRPKPPVFTPEVLPEEDIHVTDSSGEYPTRVLPTSQQNPSRKGAFNPSSINNNNQNCSDRNYRKPPRVRFAQTVSEIPLSESGVWSAPEDHNLAPDQSHFGNKLSPFERHNAAPS